MISEINPSFVEMNDLTGVFYTAGEHEALGLIIQRQQQPGGRGKGKSSLGSDLQAVLRLASQKGQLGGRGEDPADPSSRAPRTEPPSQEPEGVDIPPVDPNTLARLLGKRAVRIRMNSCARI